jgi:RHS repeat-associated protein
VLKIHPTRGYRFVRGGSLLLTKSIFNVKITVVYDVEGARTCKSVNGTDHVYTLEGNKILRESWSGNYIEPIYDINDSICGIIYNSTPYYFIKNLQGDVISIVDRNNNVLANYTYDAFGKVMSVKDADGNRITSSAHIANINRFLYRGYYFDVETRLYYLQSRYYDPSTGRFLQASEISALVSNSKVVPSFNSYTYANNNSVSVTYKVHSINANSSIVASSIIGLNGIGYNETTLDWIPNGLDTGSTIHGLYASFSTIFNNISYFGKNLGAFSDDMTMLGASIKDGVLSFNQFSWKLGKADAFGVVLGVGLDIYDSIQRGVSTGGVLLGATLTAAKGIGLIYLNKGIIYGATAIGSAIFPGVGTVIGFVAGTVVSIVVDIFASNWLGDLIDKFAK